MAQQSLEELSSIYSEASELGLTPLGVGQPQQVQDIIQHSTAAGPSQLEARSGGGGGGDSDQVSWTVSSELEYPYLYSKLLANSRFSKLTPIFA